MTDSATSSWSIEDDLREIRTACHAIWPKLRGAKIFMTGGTGFIGCWFLEIIKYVNLRDQLNIKVTILTRDKKAFAMKAPHLSNSQEFEFLVGDVRDFPCPQGSFTHIIHGATNASADLNDNDPRLMLDTILQGTRQTLELALENNKPRLLFLSSGAVYGQQPWDLTHVPEHWNGGPDCTNSRNTYAEAKRAAEMLCSIYHKQFGIEISIARIFALLGPYLPLTTHFAAGNFIRDAMLGKLVVVEGDGRPCRSYLYASDLIIWLLKLLVVGPPGKAYNVGSNETISILELAESVSNTLGNNDYMVKGARDSGWNPGRYVPDTSLATRDLGLYKTVSLNDSIIRTALWNGWKP